LIAIDKDASGLTTIITAVAGLVTAFIYGRYQQGKERARKLRPFQPTADDDQLKLPFPRESGDH